ncbi:MAG: helix-turn-helix domain-containing protein [Pseudonocardiales bacterium]|nr:helix-turn-helix domain-containing protein [Pseudonocardiales bacterium]
MALDDASERRREIGRRVARWRVRRGLTRRRFAELCERSLSWVDKVESGERGLLRLPMLERVAEVLHVSVEDLADTAEVRQAGHCLDVFEISAIRSAVQSYQAISRVFVPSSTELTEPPDLDRLAQQVTYTFTVFQNAHWPLLGQTLPRLLTTAQTAVAAYPGTDDQARRARSLLSQAYQVTASTLIKIEEFDLAWLAAERGFVLAEETGDSLLISSAARRVAAVLMEMKHYDEALELMRANIDRLEPERGDGSPAYLSVYGMLFLRGAEIASHARKPSVARDLLDEGDSVARQLGYDGNEHFTAFGLTNVRLHEVGILLNLGDGARALNAARRVIPDDLSRLPKERRASYYLAVARGHSLTGQSDDAVDALLTAESLFPDEIRCRPYAINIVNGLRRSASGTRSQELEQLAARAGLTDED